MKFTFGDMIEAHKVLLRFRKPKIDEEIFYNLIFCILVPQTTFKRAMGVLNELKKMNFYRKDYNKKVLAYVLKPARFYNRKTEFVLQAKFLFPEILIRLRIIPEGSLGNLFKRDWLVRNVNGLGMKTASHLLRNLGATDLAIIDTHVLKYLGVVVGTVKWSYLDLEKRFADRAKRYGISIAELDAIVWKHYSNTDWKDFIY